MLTSSGQYSDLISRFYNSGGQPMAVGSPHVLNATIQVTEDCNLRCTYCYQINKKPNIITFEQAKKFIDLLLEKTELTCGYCNSRENIGVVLDIIGGEPLIAIDVISQFTDYFIQRLIELDHPWKTRFRISLCTNGVLYFDEKVQEYFRKHASHLALTITVDGNKQLHDMCRLHADGSGSYEEAIAAVRHYHKTYGIMPGVKFTICPENIDYIYEAVINLINEGYTEIMMNCVYEDVWSRELGTKLYYKLKQVSDYLLDNNLEDKVYISILSPKVTGGYDDSYQQNYCGGSGLMLACDYKGDLYPCLRYMPSSIPNREPFIIGNTEVGIGRTEEHQNRIDLLAKITRRTSCSDKCYNCPIAIGCGSCNALAYQIYGNPDKKLETICDMHKAETLVSAYLENKTRIKAGRNDKFKLAIPKDWALDIISEEEYQMLEDLCN